MTKTAKNKEVLDQLYSLVVKQASAPKPVATGVPGKDPTSEAVSDKHDTVDQNAVKPENNKPQAHEQKLSTDPARPTGGKKKAEDTTETELEANPSVDKLGKDILALVQKFADNPVATGIPGKEPKSEAISTRHDTVDQNAVKPETNPQGYHQKPATDPSVPVATAKSADEKMDADKVASYELGKLWAELVIKKAQEEQLAQVKEAGRRDFEQLIAQAAEQMKQAEKAPVAKIDKMAAYNAAQAEKQAEAEGAAAFQALYKQAQFEQAVAQVVEQNNQLSQKLAAFEQAQAEKEATYKAQLAVKQAELDKVAAEEREQQKFAALAIHLEQRLIDRLQREIVGRGQ